MSTNLVRFSRQLSFLLKAKVPLCQSLESLTEQEKNPKMHRILSSLTHSINSGQPLSEALEQHPKLFSYLWINAIKAAEASETLADTLYRLSQFTENTLRTKKQIQSILVYPAILLFFTGGTVFLLVALVLPQFQKIYQDILENAPLPTLTQWVLKGRSLMSVYPLVLTGAIVSIPVLFKKAFRRWIHFLPTMKYFCQKTNLARFTRTLGTLLESNIPLLPALHIIHETETFPSCNQILPLIQNGESLASSLEQLNLAPPSGLSIIKIGEQTGQLATMLFHVAEYYEEETRRFTVRLIALIEPFALVFLAVFVGIVLLALFLPIAQMIEQISTFGTIPI